MKATPAQMSLTAIIVLTKKKTMKKRKRMKKSSIYLKRCAHV
nr:MAG TPA: hypothetical protein [Caudoviricetes sp.]